MSDIVFVSTPGAGYVEPLLPIARELVHKGHRVRWSTSLRFSAAVAAVGAELRPLPTMLDRPDVPLDDVYPERAALRGRRKMRWDLENLFLAAAPAQVAELRCLLADEPADVLVCDLAHVGARYLAELDDLPYVTVGVTAMTLASRDTAPFGHALPPRRGVAGRLRNGMLGLADQAVLMQRLDHKTRATRTLLGLGAPTGPLLSGLSPYLHLQHGVPGLEYSRTDLPRQVHFIGALVPARSAAVLPGWWPELATTTRPVVYVTQLTGARVDALIGPTFRALADDDVLVVANADRGRLGDAPSNARTVEQPPRHLLLPRLAAVVTDGDYGLVQQALASGTPLIVSGNGYEQRELAARVAWAGAGVDLTGDRLPDDAIRTAVRTVVQQPRYRDRAAELRTQYVGYESGRLAAHLIERVVTTGAPVLTT